MSPHHLLRGVTVAVAAVMLIPAFAQTTTVPTVPTTGTTTTGTGTTSPTPTRIPPISPTDSSNTNTQNQAKPPQQPVLITGRVMADDGTPPPSNTVIERVCNGSPHAEGYTDSRGYFSVQLGGTTEMVADASEGSTSFGRLGTNGGSGAGSSGSGTTNSRNFGPDSRFSNCEIRARVGGYQSQSINLLNHGAMDNPNIGTILVHRIASNEEGITVTATSLRASKPAKKAWQKGMDLVKKNKIDEAMVSLQEAVKESPDFAFAWCGLGRLQADKGLTTEAHASFEAAAKGEPRWPEPLLELSSLAARDHRWPELAELTDRILRLNSFEYPQAFFFNAVANYNLRHMEVAEKSVRSAQKLDTQHLYPQISHLLGTILADRHQYAAAADELRNYLILSPKAVDAAGVRKQLDDAERMALQTSDVARKEPR